MACFVVPMAEAIIVSIAKKIVEKKKKEAFLKNSNERISALQIESIHNLQISYDCIDKLSWLCNLLWGGVFLLALEHLWHGEIMLYPPFLSALKNPSDIPQMLHEMALVGIPMAILVTLVWVVMVIVAEHKKKCFKVKN